MHQRQRAYLDGRALSHHIRLARLRCSRAGADQPLLSKIETVAQDHFCDQMIRRAGHAYSHAKIHFPLGREIQINHRENLQLLPLLDYL
jgi:hypothetical protein